jgi:uncharacterized protein YycO
MRNIREIFSIFSIGILLFGGLLPGVYQSTATATIFQFSPRESLGENITTQKHYVLPSYLEYGDLVFFDIPAPPGRWNVSGYDHVAIYIGDDKFIGSTRNDITHTLEVNISTYSFFMDVLHYQNPMFARVIIATPEQRKAATDWVFTRIGDKYQTWDPRKCADPNASIITAKKWYCSEIVWAAYYHLGIDIDQNGWARDFPWFFPLWSSVSPQDIADDNDVLHLS